MELKQGTLLKGGQYRIVKMLGQGGFGITYLAMTKVSMGGNLSQLEVEIPMALKEFFVKENCLRNDDSTSVSVPNEGSRAKVDVYRKKFVKEAQNIAALNHPNIVHVTDVFEENNTVYYAMQFLKGGSLREVVVKNGPLKEEKALKYITSIAAALDYMHTEKKMCHLDIKPGNIMLDDKDNALLIDFGISKKYDASGSQSTDTPVGVTVGYAPNEQYQGMLKDFSPVTDVYSLGATLYYLITGKVPPDAATVLDSGLGDKPEMMSENTWLVINKAMQPIRRDRIPSMKLFSQYLNEGMPQPEITDPMPTSSQQQPQPQQPQAQPAAAGQPAPQPQPRRTPQQQPKPQMQAKPVPVDEDVVIVEDNDNKPQPQPQAQPKPQAKQPVQSQSQPQQPAQPVKPQQPAQRQQTQPQAKVQPQRPQQPSGKPQQPVGKPQQSVGKPQPKPEKVQPAVQKQQTPTKQQPVAKQPTQAKSQPASVTKPAALAQQPPKKNNTVKIIVIGIVAALLVVGIIFAISALGGSEEKKVEVKTEKVENYSYKDAEHNIAYSFTGTLKDGKPTGKGSCKYDDGRVYHGAFVEGLRQDSAAHLLMGNGDEFEGSFEADHFKRGTYKIKADKTYFEGDYKDDKPYNGFWYNAAGVKFVEVKDGEEKRLL